MIRASILWFKNRGTSEPRTDGGAQARTDIRYRISLMAAFAIPIFLETLDYTVVATAQPEIASVFHHLELQSYIGASYLLGSTAFILPFGALADIYGRHTSVQISLVFFILGSAISTGAQNIGMMLAGRGIAGVGAGGMTSVIRIILADSRSVDQNSWQIMMLTILYTIGYCVGPVIGGALTTVSFRWIFAINLPSCTLGAVLIFLLLRNKTKKGQASAYPALNEGRETGVDKCLRIDWIGIILFAGGGILLLLALNWGSTDRWDDAKVIVSFVVGAVLFVATLFWEYVLARVQRTTTPPALRILRASQLLPLDLFRSYTVWAITLCSFAQGMVTMVIFYFVAIFAVIVSGLTSTNAGLQLIYFAPGLGCGTFLSTVTTKFTRQPRLSINLGGAITCIGLGLVSMGVDQNKPTLVNGFMVLTGIGAGMVTASSGVQIRFSEPPEKQAIVTSLTMFMRAFGGTVGLAQCGAVMNSKVSSYIGSIVRSGVLSASDQALLGTGAWRADASLSSLQAINGLPSNLQAIVRAAFTSGLRWSFISLIPWCAVSALSTLPLPRIQDPGPDARSQETLTTVKESDGLAMDDVSMKPGTSVSGVRNQAPESA